MAVSFALLGNTLILCLLFGLATWVGAKAMERWSFFRSRRDDLGRVGDELVARLRHGDFDGADFVLSQSPSLEAAVVRPALEWLDGGAEPIETMLDARRIGVRRELDRSLVSIGIIGRQAPWVGLLGMIVSLVDTLRLLDQEATKDANTLVHGVLIGLIPVAVGTFVGIASTITHEMLMDKVIAVDTSIAILGKQLLALLQFKHSLAAEFGLPGNGVIHHARTSPEPEPMREETQRLRPVPLTELD